MPRSPTNQKREDLRVTICRSGPAQHFIRDLFTLNAGSEVIFDKDLSDRRRTISSWNSTLLRKDGLPRGSATKSAISSVRRTPDTTNDTASRRGIHNWRGSTETPAVTMSLLRQDRPSTSLRFGSQSCSEHTRKCNSTYSHFHFLILLLFPAETLPRVSVVVPRSHSSTHFRPDLSFHRFRRRHFLRGIGTAMCSWMYSWIGIQEFTPTIRSSVAFNMCIWVRVWNRVWKTFAIKLSICLTRTVIDNCTAYLRIRLQNDSQISPPLLRWSVIPD